MRHEYVGELPAKIAEINRHWQAIRRDPAALVSLHRLAHGLAGSGATYGFPQISDAAQSVERFLLPGLENTVLAPDAGEAMVETLLRALHAAANHRPE